MKEGVKLPGIQNLKLRNYEGRSDLKNIVRVWNGCREVDGSESPLTIEELEREFEHLTSCNLKKDILLVEKDNELIGCSMLWWEDDSEGKRLFRYYAKIVPEFRGTGLTTSVVRWVEERGKEIAKENPVDKEKKFYIVIDQKEEDLRRVLESENYRLYRYGLKMKRPDLENVPNCSLPDGIEIRAVEEEHLEKIRKAWNSVCRDLRSQVPISKEDWEQWKKDGSFDPSLWSICWKDDEVVGTCIGFIDKNENRANVVERGHTEFISTKKDWRGKGIAKALLVDVLKKLKEAGMEEAVLGVDSENPSGAVHLYRKMGFEEVGKVIFYEKALKV